MTEIVTRTKTELLEEYIGTVEDVKRIDDKMREEGEQFHIFIKPLDIEIKGETGLMHEWIRIPPKATDKTVPEGSIIDRYLQELEDLMSSVKKADTVEKAFMLMKGRTFKFKRKKLGRSFEGKEARGYWTPVKMLTDDEAKKVEVRPRNNPSASDEEESD